VPTWCSRSSRFRAFAGPGCCWPVSFVRDGIRRSRFHGNSIFKDLVGRSGTNFCPASAVAEAGRGDIAEGSGEEGEADGFAVRVGADGAGGLVAWGGVR